MRLTDETLTARAIRTRSVCHVADILSDPAEWLPWQPGCADGARQAGLKADYFRHRVAAIRGAAGISFEAKFMGLRHGGSMESGNADLTDSQIRALSGHNTTATTALHTKQTCGSVARVRTRGLKRERKGRICRNEPMTSCRKWQIGFG